jgi:hypothetical protein
MKSCATRCPPRATPGIATLQRGPGYQLLTNKATIFAKVSRSCAGRSATIWRRIRPSDRIWRYNTQILEALHKKLLFAAIDAGRTFEELRDRMLHGVGVDERRNSDRTQFSESSGFEVGWPGS